MLTARLGRDTDFVARLAAPLWARVGRTIRVEDLSWTRNLAGEEGPGIVWRALEEVGGLLSGQSRLTAEGVAQLCSALVSTRVSPSASSDPYRGLPQVVWTLPLAHIRHTSRSASYREAFVDLIDRSQKRMILVAPFVDSAGISGLMTALLTAMLRRVVVILLTNDALNIASFTSQAIEELRREAERVSGDLSVYTAEAGSGRDRLTHPLLHAKIVICDRERVLIGSANLTSHALASNLEAGVLLGREAADEVLPIIEEMISASCVHLVFRTGQPA